MFLPAAVVLLACAADVRADRLPGRTNFVETSDDKRDGDLSVNINLNIVIWPTAPENTPDIISTVVKPVNERFPSAVLFGRTCGGTIISDRWILSAAHCTLFTGGRDILAGTNNTENGTGVKVRVKRLVVHPLFSVGPYWLDAERYNIKQVAARWDFLLAELEEPLPLDGRTIVAAKLDGPTEIPAGVNVGYAGYGAEHHGETMRHQMHGMELVTLSDLDCSKLEQYNKEDMLCAVGRPPRLDSACNGDSGSGLMDGNRLIGVASWVEDDARECRKGAKVVFSRVPVARPWIRQVTGL